MRQASSGSGHGSGGAAPPSRRSGADEAVAEVEVGHDAVAAPEAAREVLLEPLERAGRVVELEQCRLDHAA